VRNTASGVNLAGYDWPNVSAQTNRVRIRQNLFYNISSSTFGGAGWFMLIGDQPRDVEIDHNTIDFDGTTAVYAHGVTGGIPKTITGFAFTNNALRHNLYGINAEASSFGNAALGSFFPGAVMTGNWLQGGSAARYPAGNVFSGTFAAAFVDAAAGDYRPSAASVLVSAASDKTNIGADVGPLLVSLAGVLDGNRPRRPRAPTNLHITR
jgi:hypothetical protein